MMSANVVSQWEVVADPKLEVDLLVRYAGEFVVEAKGVFAFCFCLEFDSVVLCLFSIVELFVAWSSDCHTHIIVTASNNLRIRKT